MTWTCKNTQLFIGEYFEGKLPVRDRLQIVCSQSRCFKLLLPAVTRRRRLESDRGGTVSDQSEAGPKAG